MNSNLWRVITAAFFAISLLAPGTLFAGADDLAKQAGKIVRKAERKMHSGKSEEAATMLQEAAALLEQGRSEEPKNSKIAQTQKKLDRIQKSVDKKLGKTAVKASSSTRDLPNKPQPKAMQSGSSASAVAAKASGNTKLPSNVKSKLNQIGVHLQNAETYLGRGKAKSAKHEIGKAGEIFELIDRRYSGKFDPAHPDFVAVKENYNALAGQANTQGDAEAKVKTDAAASKVAREKQSAEWVPKFQAYLAYASAEGHNPDKLVFVPGTSEPEKFADAKKRYEAFKKFYEGYKATDFPHGKTWNLEDLADNKAPTRLKDFEEGFASRLGSASQRAEGEIGSAMAQLEKDNGWKSNKSIRPLLVDHKRMSSISEETKRAVTALGADSPQAKQLQANFEALVDKDKENRQIRKERTFMKPDVYTGKEIKALKKKAKALVKSNAKEGGDPLRCTVIAENWREETVHEWTDTSRTVRRWRTTRHQTAQVAAETSDGVRLITVALAQDKQSDGWGPLYGNLHQGSDPMLKSNVNK